MADMITAIVFLLFALWLGTRILRWVLEFWLGPAAGAHVLGLIAFNVVAFPFRILGGTLRALGRSGRIQ